MDFQITENTRLREKICYYRHPTGLDIFVAPKKGYASQYAIFGTKYGSIDNRFEYGGKVTKVPEGIAHFLEHKLFESEDGDAFSRYAKTGASANAYTSFDRTCYLFSSTERFRDSLEILLDFVQHPYFTEKTVSKEQGIIGQEIRMYDDSPGWRVLFNLLGCLYHTHPVKIDIAGTVESISHITADLLYECYHAFYNLNNMVLSVAGDVDPDEIAATADRLLKPSHPALVRSLFEEEPDAIVRTKAEQKLAVSVPLFNFGFKDTPSSGIEAARMETSTDILLDVIAGDDSPLYRRLYDEGLINSTFGAEYFSGRSFAATIVAGESREPEKVMEAFLETVRHLKEDGIPAQDFERAKKSVYGRLAAAFDSVDNVANVIAACRFMEMSPFDAVEAAASLTLDDAQQRLAAHFSPEKAALSVIRPL